LCSSIIRTYIISYMRVWELACLAWTWKITPKVNFQCEFPPPPQIYLYFILVLLLFLDASSPDTLLYLCFVHIHTPIFVCYSADFFYFRNEEE
jgi:hypothetical protein